MRKKRVGEKERERGGGEEMRETKTSQCWECCWASSEENRAHSFVVGEEAAGLHGCEH